MNGKLFALGALALGIAVFAGLAAFSPAPEPPPAGPGGAPAELLARPHSPVKGPAEAPVTIVEFLDPECESCRAMHPILEAVLEEYAGRVRLVVRYMPLHGSSVYAASVLEEARSLGKYDQALSILFEQQPIWGSHSNPRPELIPGYLSTIGIAPERLQPDTVIAEHSWKIRQDESDGRQLGVRGTPTFFVNGKLLPRLGYGPLKQAIEAALSAAGSG